MVNNLWMDGVPYTTQCPIQPGATFTYRFIADPIGTHWYHSHLSNQKMDGLYGMLIIHDIEPVVPYFPMSVTDWVHTRGVSILADNPGGGEGSGNNYVDRIRHSFANQQDSAFTFHSILVNGKGRQQDDADPWPLEVFVVNEGDTARFRVAHTGIESALRISVDQHHLTIVSTDDGDIEPIIVESFWIFVAEAIDFEIIANKPVDNYWMRIETLGTQNGPNRPPDGIIHEGRAIVRYNTAVAGDPTTQPLDCTQNSPCNVFNCPFELYPQSENRLCIAMADARSVEQQDSLDMKYGLGQEDPDEEIFLNFNLATGSSINAIKYTSPRAPFSMNVTNQIKPCDPVDCADGCVCTHILELPKNKIVQLVMTNYAQSSDRSHHLHVAHIHGNTLAIVKEGFGPQDPVNGRPTGYNSDVSCVNNDCYLTEWASGRPPMNLLKPPLKNTIILPTQGYIVGRFNTSNSGYWRFHCHLQRHVSGMAMLLKIGDAPPVPPNFPECDNFDFRNDNEFLKYLDGEVSGAEEKEVEEDTQPEKKDKKKKNKKNKKKNKKTQAE